MPVMDRIDLTNVEGSMTNIIHNNVDKLRDAQSVRDLHNILTNIFKANDLDTPASRDLLSRVFQTRNLEQAFKAVFNSYLYGADMGRNKEQIGGKPKMFKIDTKLKKVVSEDIEKIEVETTSEEITVETDGDAVKVEIEPKCQGTECAETDCAEVELDYDFFSDLNPEIDIDDEVPTEDIESTEDEEVVDEGFLGIKTKKEKEKEAKAKAEKEAQKQRDKELKDQEERARQQSVANSWARYDRAARDAKAEYNRSSSDQGSKVSNTGKAGVYYSGGDYYSEGLNESKSIKESNNINPDIWKAIGRHFDYIIAEKAAEILENLADRALMQDNVEDTYEAVIRAIDDGLFNSADIWEINALYDECQLSDNAYSCLIDDLVQIVDTVKTGDLTEGIEKKYVKPLKDKINACYTKQDLDEIGAYLDDFSDKDIDRILSGKVSNKDLNKMFGGYNFVDDDFPGWNFKEAKCIKESADSRVNTVEYGPYDKWYEFERLYLPGKNGKHDVRIYFYEGDDAAEDYEDYDVSVDIADESILVDELKLAREIGYAGFHPYLTAFNWDGVVECCEDIYDYFMEIPQEEIYDTLVNKLGCDEEQVSRFFQPSMNESKSINEDANYDDDYKYVVHFDIDGQNMDEWFDEESKARKYALANLDNGPVLYEINENGIEEPIEYFELDESKSINEANKIAQGNEKYKGYMIRQDRKYGCYNVYDKEDEMEDSGFKTIDKAKEFIDSLDESKSIKEDMNWANGEEEYEIDSTLASAPINSIIFIKKSYGGKNRTLKFEKISTNKWDSLNKFCRRTGSYESDESLKCKYMKGATWKLEKSVNESKSIKEALSVAEFIDWHETTNYKDNENTFEAVYSILDKYPDSEDDVKAQYTAASDEDKEAISRIIDKANETATEESTVYLARAMHKMYIDGYNYQEIADTLKAPVSLVIKMIGPDSYDESLTESKNVVNNMDYYEVYVEGKLRLMPDFFYETTEEIDNILNSFGDSFVDSYDNHYFDGDKMQWASMWNIFEPTFSTDEIDDLERNLELLVNSKNVTPYEMNFHIDRDMLEDEGCLHIVLSMVSDLVVKDSAMDESLIESAEKQYVAIDIQDKDNKDNTRKYTEKQLIDFAKELIEIEEESSEPDQYKKRPELKDDLASAKKVLKYFMYDVKEVE